MSYDILNIISRMEMETGINPTFIYCIQTGAPVGTINYDELRLAIEIGGCEDEDEIIDDLQIRTLISMRPSIVWNSLDSRSMHRLRKSAPRQLLAYLMNRCYEPRSSNGNLKLQWNERIDMYRARIEMFRLCATLQVSDATLNQILLVLLRLDSDFNLHTINQRTNSIPSPAIIHDDESANKYVETLWEWHDILSTKKNREEREARLSNQFWGSRGNTVMRDATTRLIIESAPRSEATIKRNAKKKADDDIIIMLRTVMEQNQSSTISSEPRPTYKPKGIIKTSGMKFKLAGNAA